MTHTYEEQIQYLNHLIKNLDEVKEMYTAFQNYSPPDLPGEEYTLGEFILDFSPQYIPKEREELWHNWRDNPYDPGATKSLLIEHIREWSKNNLSKGLDK